MMHKSGALRFALFTIAVMLLTQAAVAADLNGKWNFVFVSGNGEHPRTFVITVNGEGVSAKLGEEDFRGTFAGNKLELSGEHFAPEAGYKATMKISGELDGDQLKGTANWDTYNLTFTATRAE